MRLPGTLPNGYLPPGVYEATLEEMITQFGSSTPRRQTLATYLQVLLQLARATGKLKRAFVWGSFVTDKPVPGDLDIFLLMREGFDQEFVGLPAEQGCVFDHERARLLFDADVFWATETIGVKELESWLNVYQLSRNMQLRGIVEVLFNDYNS